MSNGYRAVLDDGKYEIIFEPNPHRFVALRNGEPWRNLTGDKMILAMLAALDAMTAERDALRAELAALKAPMTTLPRPMTAAERATEAKADEVACEEREPGRRFICCLPANHAGEHKASDGTTMLAVWR